MTDFQLLQTYARDGSQEAFAELMGRHFDWVCHACRRQVGDALAEDVTQAVFFTLARKAGKLHESTSISGWLFITTRYAAASALRIQRRRQRHETQAGKMRNQISQEPSENPRAPEIDAALAKLKSTDREAVILRFFRGLSHESIGQMLSITQEAAQKRVNRALDRLRKKLGAGDVAGTDKTSTLSSITATLAGYASQKAPEGLQARGLAAMISDPSANTQNILKGMSHMNRIFRLKIAAVTAGFGLLAGIAAVIALDVQPSSSSSQPPTTLPSYDLSEVHSLQTKGQINDLSFVNYYTPVAVVHQTSSTNWSATNYILGDKEWSVSGDGMLILRKKPAKPAVDDYGGTVSQIKSLQGAKCTREPGMDANVNGVMCQAYHLLDAPKQSKNTYVFLDPATNRPTEIRSDDPATDLTIQYDPHLPDDFFKVPAVAGSKTMDALDYFQQKYPLDGAVYQKEGVGQIFAVHEATEDASGFYHIICSCRLSPDVREALKDEPDDEGLGKFMMDKAAGLPFHYIRLDELNESGMQVTYLLAIPQKPQAQDNVCQLPVTMASAPKVFTTGHATRGPRVGHDVHIEVDLNLERKPNAETAEQFAARAYDACAPLVGIVGGGTIFGPTLGSGIDTKENYLAALTRELDQYRPDAAASQP